MKNYIMMLAVLGLTAGSVTIQAMSPQEFSTWYLSRVAFFQGKSWFYNLPAAVKLAKQRAEVGAAVGAVKGGIKSLEDRSWESAYENIARESAQEALHGGVAGVVASVVIDYWEKRKALSYINGILKKYNPELRFQDLTPLQAMAVLAAFDYRRNMFDIAAEYEEVQQFMNQPGIREALEDILYRR